MVVSFIIKSYDLHVSNGYIPTSESCDSVVERLEFLLVENNFLTYV